MFYFLKRKPSFEVISRKKTNKIEIREISSGLTLSHEIPIIEGMLFRGDCYSLIRDTENKEANGYYIMFETCSYYSLYFTGYALRITDNICVSNAESEAKIFTSYKKAMKTAKKLSRYCGYYAVEIVAKEV